MTFSLTTSHPNSPAVNIGMICMIVAMILLPIGDVFAKLLTADLHPVAVAMWRFLAQAMVLIPVALLMRKRLSGGMFSPIVALSGALVCVTFTGLVAAFAVMPIATAIAIFFVEPLLLTVLAWPFLGERAGPRRLVAVGVGLIGALIVIRPGMSSYGWTTALPLLSALAYACNMIVMKRACATRSSLTLQCGATMFAAAIMAVAILILFAIGTPSLVPIANDAGVWGAILGTGAFAAASFVLIAEAFRRADASTLAPLQYLEIIGATLAGWFVFSTFPDGLTWFGLGIILCSGLYIYHREGGAATAAPRRRRGGR